MKKKFFASLVLACSSLISFTASAVVVQTVDFSSITLADTQTAGAWYPDQYPPVAFVSIGGKLVVTISSGDSETNRPVAYASPVYNTQGRKLDLDPGVTALSIDLFVDPIWQVMNRRMAGIWATAVDDSNVLTSFPILEYASDGGRERLQGWDVHGTWTEFGLPSSFTYGWHNLGFKLNGPLWDYYLDDALLGSVNAYGSTHLANVIIEGYNTYGYHVLGEHNIAWDNLVASNDLPEQGPNNVPEPGTLPLALSALAGGFMIRRRKNAH